MTTTYILKFGNSDLGGGADFNKELSGGTEASNSLTVSLLKSETRVSNGYTIANTPSFEGLTGDYIVEINVTSGNASVNLSSRIGRVNSAGTEQAVSTYATAQAATAGVKTFNFSAIDLGTWAKGDRLRINYQFVNTDSMSAASVTIGTGTTNEEVTAPWTYIPTSVIWMWPSTVATIPANWIRMLAMDGKYVRGVATASTDPGASGGQTTHTHTSPTHNHTTVSDHQHPISDTTGTATETATPKEVLSFPRHSSLAHTHASVFSTNQDTNITNNSTVVVLDATSNDAPYFDVIFIKSSTETDTPDDCLAFWNAASLPANWNQADGAGGRPDLRNRFVKGATAGGDGGGTGGSSDAHTHTNTTHTHTTVGTHGHPAKTSANAIGTIPSGGTGTGTARNQHTHAVTLAASAVTNPSNTVSIQNADGQPPFEKLLIIQNNKGSADLPNNIIAMFSGLLSTIPTDWVLCDGTNNTPNLLADFIKGANTSGELNNTGGGTSHSHTADAHNHDSFGVADSHTHTGTGTAASLQNNDTAGSPQQTVADSTHTHTWTVNANTHGNNAATITVDSSTTNENIPSYFELAYIQWQGGAVEEASHPNSLITYFS